MLLTPCPLIGENINELDRPADSNTLKYLLNTYIIPRINLIGGGAGSGLDLSISGPGRVVGIEFLSGDPGKPTQTTPPTDGIELQIGTYLLADASGQPQKIDLSAPFTISELPTGLSNAYPHYRAFKPEDSDDLSFEWHPDGFGNTPNATLLAQGFPCIGKVSTGADSTTDYTPGLAGKESLVQTNTLQQALFARLAPSSGGGSIDLSSYATLEYVDQQNADQDARIDALANGPEQVQLDLSQIFAIVGAILVGLGEVNPHAIERVTATAISGESGKGQHDSPDFSPTLNVPGELEWNENEGVFGS